MQILSVTLKNFKTHSDRHFQFQPGTNAICGENGAGKTSILEAIAWTLFNYRGAYRNEDLIRNGAASAQASVALISSRDGRTYEVQRCTAKGYTLFDPQLAERLPYKHIDDEVMPWLRQHLGVAPGTDLARLFANTVGVPQGTFTADFLLTPEKRKPIFDAILKVEEYRQANQQGLALEKYAKAEVDNLGRAIAQYDDSLKDWEALQQRRQDLHQEILAAETALQGLQSQLQQIQAEKDQVMATARQVQQLTTQVQQLTAQIEAQQTANRLLDQAMQRAQQAVQICTQNRPAYDAYGQAETALQALEQRVKQRQQILDRRQTQQQALAQRQTDLTRLSLQLETLAQAKVQLGNLEPLVQQQLALELQQASLQEQIHQLQSQALELQSLKQQQQRQQAQQQQLSQEIMRLQGLDQEVQQIPTLEQQRDRLQQQLSRVEAARQFEAELRQLVAMAEDRRDRHQDDAEAALAILQQMQDSVPLLANASVQSVQAALSAGVSLNTEMINALWKILADLSEQTSVPKLQQQMRQVKAQLDTAYRQQAELTTLDAKLAQQAQGQQDLAQIQGRLVSLEQVVAAEPDLQQQRAHFGRALEQLGNPRGQQQLLARDLQQLPQVQAQHSQRQQAMAEIQQAIAQLEAELAQFAELDAQIDRQKQVRQAQQAAHLTYLQHQKDAESLPVLERDRQITAIRFEQLETARATLQQEYEELMVTYDPQRAAQVEATYNQTRSQADQLTGGLPQQHKLLQELDHQLTALQAIAARRQQAQIDLKQRERLRRFITFSRKVYKEAGPRITERYVQSISREADKLFRELMNRQNVVLDWTRDYEITVQEGAHSRRFINLSGGEQMCAALAVRLALLRVLADIDVAFFDEPTTNMDRPRRESLAEAIANIKTFQQLFVISHDDTFEKVTENVILVQRE